MSQPHQIRRLILDVAVEPPADARQVQARVTSLCHGPLADALDEACTGTDKADRHLLIPRLELDLGRISAQDLDTLPHRVGRALRRRLQETVAEATASSESTRDEKAESPELRTAPAHLAAILRNFFTHGTLRWPARPWAIRQDFIDTCVEWLEDAGERRWLLRQIAERPSVRGRLLGQFDDEEFDRVLAVLAGEPIEHIHRLRSRVRGYTANLRTPGAGAASGPAAENEVVLESLLVQRQKGSEAALPSPATHRAAALRSFFLSGDRSGAAGLWQNRDRFVDACLEWLEDADERRWLRRQVARHPAVRRRLTQQFDAHEFRRLCATLMEVPPARIDQLREPAERFLERLLAGPQPAPSLTTESGMLVPEPIVLALLARDANETTILAALEEQLAADLQQIFRDRDQGSADLARVVRQAADALPPLAPLLASLARRTEKQPATTASREPQTRPHPTKSTESEPTEPNEDRTGEFPIENAGLVLLGYFLPALFENLDLIDDGRFRDMEARLHAVQLSQFLVTGRRLNPEYELTLNKVLCGLPLQAPVPLDVGLTDEETEEGEALLRSAIEHWKTLKNTSPDGLREGFLRRPGILAESPDEWTLQVERRGPDVLLETVPWTYGVIRYDWSDKPLVVEW